MFATRRHLAAVSTSGHTEIVDYSRTVAAGRENVYRTLIANRGRSIEWSSYFCYASPPSGGFYFRSYRNRGLLENGGSWTRNVYRTLIANRGRSIEWSSYFCYASPPSGGFYFRFYKNRGLLENGGSWTKNDYRTLIANRGRSIECSSYFCYASPPSGGFYFRFYKNRGLLENGGSWTRKCIQNTNSKSGSVYRMVELLLLRVAT
jgi:hypothetical protein